ncbi:MAG: DUF2723 domain-containing protein [Phycisphaerae bacterium]|nr:DUF2723 domain-containing protein [Phycisphaerae bacterium]
MGSRSLENDVRSTSRLGLGGWFAVAAVFCLLYVATAQRSVNWQDSGDRQWRCLVGDYHGDMGLSSGHPLFIVVGHGIAQIAPLQHLPFILTILSGIGMAVAVANIAALGTRLTGRKWIGLLGAATLGICHTAWWLSTVTEVYTWSVAGFTVELYLLVALLHRPRWGTLAALAGFCGLGLCVHNFALLAMPVYFCVAVVLIFRRRLPAWSLVTAGVAYLLGAGLYIGMTAELAVRTGDLWGAIGSALMGKFSREVLNLSGSSKNWKANFLLVGMNFVNLLLPLAIVGWFAMRRRLGGGLAAALGAITVIHVGFFVRYPIPDQFTFFLPSLVMIVIAAMIGMAALADRSRRWQVGVVGLSLLFLVIGPIFYAVAPRLAGPRGQRFPFRDESRYWLMPWKHNEHSARDFALAALAEAGPNGVILPDNTSRYPLLLVQRLEGKSPDVSIQYLGKPLPPFGQEPKAFHEILAGRELFMVNPPASRTSPSLGDVAQWLRYPGGVLYRAEWKKTNRK